MQPPKVYASSNVAKTLLVGPFYRSEEGALACIVEFDISLVDLHSRGGGGVAIVPDQSAAGENDMDLIIIAGHWVLQRSELGF